MRMDTKLDRIGWLDKLVPSLRPIDTVQRLPTTIARNSPAIYFSRHLHACNFWPYNTKKLCAILSVRLMGDWGEGGGEITKKMADSRRTALLIIVAIVVRRKKRRRRVKSVWEKEWLRRRTNQGVFGAILQELRVKDQESYRRYLRMDTATSDFTSFFVSAAMLQKTYTTGLPTRVLLLQKHQNCIQL